MVAHSVSCGKAARGAAPQAPPGAAYFAPLGLCASPHLPPPTAHAVGHNITPPAGAPDTRSAVAVPPLPIAGEDQNERRESEVTASAVSPRPTRNLELETRDSVGTFPDFL